MKLNAKFMTNSTQTDHTSNRNTENEIMAFSYTTSRKMTTTTIESY